MDYFGPTFVHQTREPKFADLVVVWNKPGQYKVVAVHKASKTVTLKRVDEIGRPRTGTGFPWSLLTHIR
jgi:hypothetical protein